MALFRLTKYKKSMFLGRDFYFNDFQISVFCSFSFVGDWHKIIFVIQSNNSRLFLDKLLFDAIK